MKTGHLRLYTDRIETYLFWVGWRRDGQMGWHNVYKNGELIKRIL